MVTIMIAGAVGTTTRLSCTFEIASLKRDDWWVDFEGEGPFDGPNKELVPAIIWDAFPWDLCAPSRAPNRLGLVLAVVDTVGR